MITSRKNEKISYIKKLFDKKFRKAENKYIVEGLKMVKEAVCFGMSIESIVGIAEMLSEIKAEGIEIIEVSRDVYQFLSDEMTPQGILAVIKTPDTTPKKPEGSCILLDRVRDPGNLGTIMRTAAACGIKDLYLYDTAGPFNPKTVRSSMSGIFIENIYIGELNELLSVIDKPIVVADADGENVFFSTTCGDFCLVIGNEANGVSDKLMNIADKKVSIPMQNGIESLNAGISAGILMYILCEKRR